MKLRHHTLVKFIACCLLAIFAATSCGTIALLVNLVDSVQVYRQSYTQTNPYRYAIAEKAVAIQQYYSLESKRQANTSLPASDAGELDSMHGLLFPPAGCNLVWMLTDNSGDVLLSNLEETQPKKLETISQLTDNQYEQIAVDSGFVLIGLRKQLLVRDSLSEGVATFALAKKWFIPLIILAILSLLMCVVLFSFQIAATGHRPGQEGIVLNPLDRIWIEPLLVGMTLCVFLGAYVLLSPYASISERIFGSVIAVIGTLAGFFSLVRRTKAKTLYSSSMLCLIIRCLKAIIKNFQLLFWIVFAMVAYALFQIILIAGMSRGNSLFTFFWFLQTVSMIILVCIVLIQYERIQKATDRMAQGELGQLVDEKQVSFFPHIARNINNTGNVMKLAVKHAMQSEHMKTELITNVSHDIKTPLTSIINYVDLLKTTDIQDPKALEYVGILDRKSRRLAQLMIDLVEASKVTTGNVSVNIEILNLGELIKQAGGEFESRLEERNIQMVCSLPETHVFVYADGRHLWRVLDNLFSNAAKYALDATRVYVDVVEIGNNVLLTVKNISRDALNIRPEELMERFVRGDEARNTEGSGLGLSIARSLMELQHGKMSILIDGDLFKVVLTLQRAVPLEATSSTESRMPSPAPLESEGAQIPVV